MNRIQAWSDTNTGHFKRTVTIRLLSDSFRNVGSWEVTLRDPNIDVKAVGMSTALEEAWSNAVNAFYQMADDLLIRGGPTSGGG
jgi:hypothetical protein